MDTAEMVNLIFGIVISGAMCFIGWSLKEIYSQIKADKDETKSLINELNKKIDRINNKVEAKVDTEIAKLENKICKLEEKLPEKYALKSDFYREINKLENKIDGIKEDLSEIHKSIASIITLLKGVNEN